MRGTFHRGTDLELESAIVVRTVQPLALGTSNPRVDPKTLVLSVQANQSTHSCKPPVSPAAMRSEGDIITPAMVKAVA